MSLMQLAANISIFISSILEQIFWVKTMPYISLSWMSIERKSLSEKAVYQKFCPLGAVREQCSNFLHYIILDILKNELLEKEYDQLE